MPEKTIFLCLVYGTPEIRHSQRILVTDINISLLGTNRIGSNEHSLNDMVRIPFKQGTVHISARIPFISIADDKLLPSLCFSTGLPLRSGWKSPASSASPASFLAEVDH